MSKVIAGTREIAFASLGTGATIPRYGSSSSSGSSSSGSSSSGGNSSCSSSGSRLAGHWRDDSSLRFGIGDWRPGGEVEVGDWGLVPGIWGLGFGV